MTLLVTTLYNQHGKAKAKAAEVAESLTKVVGHTVAIGTAYLILCPALI